MLLASVLVLVGLSGCSTDEVLRFGLPEPASDQSPHIGNLWVGFWVAAFVVGALVWGLIIWAIIRYRKKDGDESAPRQTQYHLPLELLYTLVPFLIIGVLFLYTIKASDEVLDQSGDPDLAIDVIGQKWSWTFNHHGADNPDIGVDAHEQGTPERIPDLVLPVGQTVRFNLNSADVIHSFWIPAFYFKMDVVPGMENSFDVTPNQEGTFDGKCAEFCGEYHANMVFEVHVVSEEEYAQYVQDLAASGGEGLEPLTLTSNLEVPQPAPEEEQ